MAALCVFLAAACCYDYRDKRIPNYLMIFMLVFGVVWKFLVWKFRYGSFMGAALYVAETVLVMGLLYPFFKIGTIGAGDVKLFGVTAGYLPFQKILFFLFFSLLIAAIVSLLKMYQENSLSKRLEYLREYLRSVVGSGSWQPYLKKGEDKYASGICLSGPILAGILLYVGGVY